MLAPAAASSLDKPNAIAAQNLLSSSRPATAGRPGEGNGALPERSERRRFNLVIVTPHEALRRLLESALSSSERDRIAEHRSEVPEFSSPPNPLGVKGIGESGCVPAAGAIISALVEMRHY